MYQKMEYGKAQEQSLVKFDKTSMSDKDKNKQTKDDDNHNRDGPPEKIIDTSGFQPPPDRTMKVTFHVLLPKEAWNWEKESCLCLQFDHPNLGQWKEDIGEFIKKRYSFCA